MSAAAPARAGSESTSARSAGVPYLGPREIAADLLAYTAAVVLFTLAFVAWNLGDLLVGLVFVYLASIDPMRLWSRHANRRR